MIAHYLFPYLTNINPPVSVRDVKETHPYRTMDGFFDFSNLVLFSSKSPLLCTCQSAETEI